MTVRNKIFIMIIILVLGILGFLTRNLINEKYKYEGDGCSPIGIFSISQLFGWGDNQGFDIEYKKVDDYDYWLSEDNYSKYNVWVRREKGPDSKWKNYEKLKINLYEYAAVINYNMGENKIVGAGSAIFLHILSEKGYTHGCTATSKENLLNILRWLKKDKHPVIIQGPVSELKNMGVHLKQLDGEKLLLDFDKNIQQVIIATTESQKAYKSKINTFEKVDGKWKQVFDTMDAAIGKNGFKFVKNKNLSISF